MNIKSILRSRLGVIIRPSALALLLASCATDVATNPKLAQAAKWQEKEEQKQFERSKHELQPVALYTGSAPEAADPMVDTPYGRYRMSVLKRAIRQLEKNQAQGGSRS